MTYFSFQDSLMYKCLFEIEICLHHKVTFDQMNVSLLNKSINLFQKYINDLENVDASLNFRKEDHRKQSIIFVSLWHQL